MAKHTSGKKPTPTLQEQLPELRPGQSVDLLKALHILTRDGKLNQDSRRKLKQVYHLVQFIEPLIAARHKERGAVTLVDHGAGKSYLGFILYDLVLKALNGGQVIGIETRQELVERSAALAKQLGFEGMTFHALSVEQAMTSKALPDKVDVVTALHACDTATDDAISFGLQRQAQAMVVVPCCQAEMASVMRHNKALNLARTPLAELWRHPLHTREFGSQMTNVLRCLRLEASGYHVTVTELVGWEHSMKNELILAKRVGGAQAGAQEKIDRILAEMGLEEMAQRFAGASR
ncbi:SAM-dependent methyltransferase [Comamonadaceae bacterium M7527]|nr:SAM-dependent methyltransferase [Comamonadaceae bacterium M7527]